MIQAGLLFLLLTLLPSPQNVHLNTEEAKQELNKQFPACSSFSSVLALVSPKVPLLQLHAPI